MITIITKVICVCVYVRFSADNFFQASPPQNASKFLRHRIPREIYINSFRTCNCRIVCRQIGFPRDVKAFKIIMSAVRELTYPSLPCPLFIH